MATEVVGNVKTEAHAIHSGRTMAHRAMVSLA
jgi:hypothetical protein